MPGLHGVAEEVGHRATDILSNIKGLLAPKQLSSKGAAAHLGKPVASSVNEAECPLLAVHEVLVGQDDKERRLGVGVLLHRTIASARSW